ncbi:MAG: MnhB domain-containing protein [Eubacteriales bacterium]|nr:MnhB domain-containing protein [Eubacteriales bacterium]
MARIKKDFERSRMGRFLDWVNGGGGALDRHMQESLEKEPGRTGFELERAILREEHYQEEYTKELLEERQLYRQMHLWMRRKGSKWIDRFYRVLAGVVALMIIWALIMVVAELPRMGDQAAPTMNEVVRRYSEDGLAETGAVNIVAGMILDYRAFDTLGESNVLFIAVCSVLMLLRVRLDENGRLSDEKRDAEENDRRYEPHKDTILQRMADVLAPVVLLFGVYILFNGHLSPGGGFSGGAIMGAGLILYLNAHGYTGTRKLRLFSYGAFKWVSFAALSFYCLSKCYSFFTGANHLESIIGPGTPGSIFSAGLILPLNVAVGFVVAFTMFGFYTLFRKGDF